LINEVIEAQHSPNIAACTDSSELFRNASAKWLGSSKVGKNADALSPFRILNKHAMVEDFCVQNVLEPGPLSAAANRVPSQNCKGHLSRELHDPVAVGLINLPVAMQLFDR